MKKRYLIPTILVSLTFISATTYGVTRLIQESIPGDEPRANPLVILNAKDAKNGFVGQFASGDDIITRTVRRGTTWGSYKTNMPTPTLSGFDLMGWQVSLTGTEGSWSNINDEFVFEQNTYLRVSEWGSATANSFANDSWATIVNEAAKGLASLKSVYYDDLFKNHPEYNNSFIIQNYDNQQEVDAKTRIVNLKGIGDFRVRVIGEDQDEIAGSSGSKVATLTFEFVDAVEPALGFSKGTDSDSWADSFIKYYLDNSFIYRLPDPINRTDVLQTVVKKTLTSQGDSRLVRKTNDRLFLPSISELGFRRVLDGTTKEYPGIFETSFDEGNAYEFYRINANRSSSRIKYFNSGSEREAVHYWTRSPFTTSALHNPREQEPEEQTMCSRVHIIDQYGHSSSYFDTLEAGGMIYTEVTNATNAVAPCFCIGQDDAFKLNVSFASGTDVIARVDSTLSKGSVAKIQLYDTRDMTAPVYNIKESATKPLFKITSNGVDLPKDYYFYDAGNGLLTINVPSDYDLTGSVDVKVLATQTHGDFETCDWSDLIEAANSGYANLVEAYNDEYIANGGTFAGLKKKITLSYPAMDPSTQPPTPLPPIEVDTYVRVIGEDGHDKTTVDSTETPVPLTFMFTEGLGCQGYGSMVPALVSAYSSTPDSIEYTNSLPYSVLHGNEGVLSIFPSEVQSGAKAVNKKVGELHETGDYTLEDFQDKLFLLSYEELTGMSDLIPLSGEGTQYEYYQIYGNNSYECFIKSTGKEAMAYQPTYRDDHYWLRSIATNKKDAITVNAFTGGIDQTVAYGDDTETSIVPAFAIGQGE